MHRLIVCFALLAVLTSCGGSRRETEEVLLLDLLELAETVLETSGITFGEDTPPDTLISGFSKLETFSDGRDAIWAMGQEAWIYPWLGTRRSRVLTLTVRPLVAPGISSQSITVEWNGEKLFHKKMENLPRWQTLHIAVPEEVQVEGRNRLCFRFARSDRPRDCLPDDQDARSLNVAFDALVIETEGRFAPGLPVPQSRIEVSDEDGVRVLRFISPGEIRYNLRIPPDSRFGLRYRAAEATGEFCAPFFVRGTLADGTVVEILSAKGDRVRTGWQTLETSLDGATGQPVPPHSGMPPGWH